MRSADLGRAPHFSLISAKELKMLKKLAAVVVSVAVVVSLTACTPPLPPEIRSALAEREYTCVEGSTTISVPESTTDMASGWEFAVAEACPGMSIKSAFDEVIDADLIFTNLSIDSKVCDVSIELPFAVDSGVLVYQLSGGNTFNFTPALISKIFSGEINDWSDPEISKVNLDVVFPSGPILIKPTAFEPALSSFNAWLTRLDASYKGDRIKPGRAESARDFSLIEGEIAIIPNSIAQEIGYSPAGLVYGDDYSLEVVYPDSGAIGAAATQFDIVKKETSITVKHNSKNPAQAAPGAETALRPYEAAYAVPLYVCGDATLAKRAAARFILRQDQQGSIAATYFVQLPEVIRVAVLDVVSEGLTLPVIDPENLPVE